MHDISADDITPRTIVGWWDGMTSGLAEMGGRPVWLELDHATERDDIRRYFVYPLTLEESELEWAKHRRFEELVGSHWCLRERCGTDYADFPGNENYMDFYEEYPPREQPVYTDRPPLGSVRLQVPRNAAARNHLG